MKFRNSQRGVALVLTLIMLAIITIVVVVFLAAARRNRSATTVRKDQTDAEFAAEAAYQQASARVIAQILRDTNLLSFDFLVSAPFTNYLGTNYPNYAVATNPWPFPNTNNPPDNRPYNSDEIPIVANQAGSVDVYLDLNRNRRFDIPVPYGDPIWLGILEKPGLPHGAKNRFIARFAYALIPAGKALDLNTIHNEASPNGGFNFLRNQGFGPWELNLAGFFAELSPTIWWVNNAYSYGPYPKPVGTGRAFADARSIVDYRNAWGQDLSPRRVTNTYPAAFPDFPPPSIDAYSDGIDGLVLGANPFLPDHDDSRNPGWAGADSTNHFFDIQELFQVTNSYSPNRVTPQFYSNLTNAIGSDPEAYYRLIAQLGTDSGSDYHDRINLNYVAVGTNSASDFISWDATPDLAVTFFTNVAERIFRAQSNEFNNLSTNQLPLRSITQIPVYPTNLYSSAIHRILQEAANIFDATRTNPYPSVFRPLFGTLPGDPRTLYITGYVNDERVSTLGAWMAGNSNGIPLVIGAKKGFPNFNELTLRSDFLVARKLQVTRPSIAPGTRPNGTNQMYVLGISNYFGVETWNSYDVGRSGPYPGTLNITVSNYALLSLTNNLNFQATNVFEGASVTNITGWRGGETLGFVLPFSTNTVFLSNGVYRFNLNRFVNVSTNDFESFAGFPLPYWVFTISNRLTCRISENVGGVERIIDFVSLTDNQSVDLYRDLVAGTNPYDNIPGGTTATLSGLWSTNRSRGGNGPTDGLVRQMDIALGTEPTVNADWRAYALTGTGRENDKNAAIDAFRNFCGLAPLSANTFRTNDTLAMQAPFNPAARLSVLSTWQANDPLVHYHPADLRMGGSPTNTQYLKPSQSPTNIYPSTLGRLNNRYSPWGGNPQKSSDPNEFNRTIKDPGVYSSDDWNFPNGKLASIGLLGRVHRGTPWQTIYFKSEAAGLYGDHGWTNQSPDIAQRPNGLEFSRTQPTNDWNLADMFTTAIDDRTSRGLLSINQTNLESWSALLSGVVVLSNSIAAPILKDPRQYQQLFITPNGTNRVTDTGLGRIWKAIHDYQTNVARPLKSVGDLLQVPELTVRSPFLNADPADPQQVQQSYGIDDFAYEQIPQQILSLLRLGQSRFVIYAYGQALKPAQIDAGSGVVQNYQVTAEYATRTVVRAEGDPFGRVRLVVESFNILPPD